MCLFIKFQSSFVLAVIIVVHELCYAFFRALLVLILFVHVFDAADSFALDNLFGIAVANVVLYL